MSLRPQFKIQNLLWLTFWFSIWGGTITLWGKTFGDDPRPIWPSPLIDTTVFFSFFLLFLWSPVIALASLFRRNGSGLVIFGIIAVFFLVVISIGSVVLPHTIARSEVLIYSGHKCK